MQSEKLYIAPVVQAYVEKFMNERGYDFTLTRCGDKITIEVKQSTQPPPTLKACGHCGRPAERQSEMQMGDRLHQVICSHCLMCTPWCSTEEAADAIWNRRTQ